MVIKAKFYLLLLLTFFGFYVKAQNFSLTARYTIENGLPSDHIYETVEDKDGILWVATNNGVSRYDGKRFINYTTRNGLSSNDALQIKMDYSGTLWVNCYKQAPCYFDKKNNQFIAFENNAFIKTWKNQLAYIEIHPTTGIFFRNSLGSIYFKNNRIQSISKFENNQLFVNNNQYHFTIDEQTNKRKINKFYNLNNELLASIVYFENVRCLHRKVYKNKIYSLYPDSLKIETVKNSKPYSATSKIIKYKDLKWFTLSKKEIILFTKTGTVYFFDNASLQLKQTLTTQKDINNAFKDNNETIWIATINGLLKYNTSNIKNLIIPKEINPIFLSITVTDNNRIIAGNFHGEVFENGKMRSIQQEVARKNTTWVRNVSVFKNKIIAVSDYGFAINNKKIKSLLHKNGISNVTLKTALKLNDSILIFGTNNGLYKLNVSNEKYTILNSPEQRVLSISKVNDSCFNYVTNAGIFKYNLVNKKSQTQFLNSSLKNQNIAGIYSKCENRIWFYTVKGDIYLLKKNKIIFKIINNILLPLNINKIIEIDSNLWIASTDGIYQINISKLPNYSVNKFTKSDGLTSNFVNDITCKNDTIYVATNNGLSKFHKNIKNKNSTIFPILVSLKVNNTFVPIQDKYNLENEQRNVVLDIAAANLTGHFNRFEYCLNNKDWYVIEGNILNLILNEGANNVTVRAINNNNIISNNKLELHFNVAVPFYKKTFFYILLTFCISGLFFFIFNKRKFDKQKRYYQQQLLLEKERNKITADLHDEIGSTLSSLQINTSIANQIIEKDINESKNILSKVENQSKSLSEKIGDIIWSMKPSNDEFMTLSTRIKNYCNEVLGSTNINYSIEIDNEIDTLLTDFTVRKNILLITKEAINNALKYSKASNIEVAMQLNKNRISLLISDNGIGFNPQELKGNGLGNMKKRAIDIKASFDIISNENEGTSINVQFNLIP